MPNVWKIQLGGVVETESTVVEATQKKSIAGAGARHNEVGRR